MKKFLHSLLILFMGINTAAFAQQEEAVAVETWDGSNMEIEMVRGDKMTFMYKATGNGRLYIYADDQSTYDNLPVSIWGGYWPGAYDPDATLQETGFYESNSGIYAWIDVFEGDNVRFTLTTSEEAEGRATSFTLKSVFFPKTGSGWMSTLYGGDFEHPIELTKNTKVALPTFENTNMDMLPDVSHATYCSFVAPGSGLASIFVADESLIYYIEADKYGVEALQFASQDESTDDHEFVVEVGKTYLVIVPNTHPTDVTLKFAQTDLGGSVDLPIEITEFPATLNFGKGNTYYRFSNALVGEAAMLEVAAAAGWSGTVTYMDANKWGAEESTELTENTVSGSAVTFYKNIDTRFLMGDAIMVNFNVASGTGAATLTLREPAEGESFETATPVTLGENTFEGPARDYWFAYTAEADAEYSFATSDTLKHVNLVAGVELMVPDNVYRLHEGETICVCVAATAESNTFTVSKTEIVDGDYCDRPKYFELGQELTIEGRGRDCFYSFTAEETGFALFTSPAWSVHFRTECGGRRLDCQPTIIEEGELKNEVENSTYKVTYIYKLPVEAGQSYIVELEAVSEDVVITTGSEGAVSGDVCATAIAIETLNDTIKLDYAFGVEKWYKITADKSGYFTIYAKLGQYSNMKTKLGGCDVAEVNASGDANKPNYVIGGYKAAKVYVQEGQVLYIYTKTGENNGGAEFSEEFYLVPTFAEARPGEDVAVAITAKSATEYEVMTNTDGYEQWYTYTIPAGKEMAATLVATVKYYGSLSFYREDKTTPMSSGKGDFTQTNITNDAGVIIGKKYSFPTTDTDRTIYIKIPAVNAMYVPVVWSIECDDEDFVSDIETPTAANEAPVIYDLMGRRVEKPGKGIYIINGVKRVIK